MYNITDDCLIVCGGNPAYVGVGIGVAVYTGASALISATQTLNKFGQNVGQTVFEALNNDPLGQMTYTENDFKETYS